MSQAGSRLLEVVRPLFESGAGNDAPGVRGTWWAAYNAMTEWLTHLRGSQQGDAFDATAFESIDNKRKVLDTMIDQRVLRMAADRSGIAVGDAQVREQIESIPAFQVGGKFNAQQ